MVDSLQCLHGKKAAVHEGKFLDLLISPFRPSPGYKLLASDRKNMDTSSQKGIP